MGGKGFSDAGAAVEVLGGEELMSQMQDRMEVQQQQQQQQQGE